MVKNLCVVIFVLMYVIVFQARSVFAIEDPLSIPNNKVGVHILFPTEVNEAAKLVNANNGNWGYITIPIQTNDRDLEKWQKFLNECREFRVIPIFRLATEGDYFNTKVWRKPNNAEILDFANFLSSLQFPTKNRYVIVFNEVNRGDEWEGFADASEYAEILRYAVTAFKSKSDDFFIISAGLDNAHQNSVTGYNEYDFFRAMEREVPGIFNLIDGISSHSYPNPGFSQPPSRRGPTSVASFLQEKSVIESFTDKSLPVFITETGWSLNAVSESRAAQYYREAFNSVWNDTSIVAVTPFILTAGTPPFDVFSLLDENGSPRLTYKAIQDLEKVKGEPLLAPEILGVTLKQGLGKQENLPTKDLNKIKNPILTFSVPKEIKILGKWLLKL